MAKTLMCVISSVIFALIFSYQANFVLPTTNGLTVYSVASSTNCAEQYILPESFAFIKKSSYGGESTAISQTEKQKLIKKYRAKKVLSESGKEFFNEYYYSPLLPKYVIIEGKKVNLHFSERDKNIAVGYPFIFGWY